MELSGLDNIRWVIEDALKFVKREVKRGNRYNGLILDPPAYGHGPEGEKWKLDELLFDLLKGCKAILEPEKSFMVLNLYSNGYSAVLAETAVRSAFGLLNVDGGKRGEAGNANSAYDIKYGELALKDKFGKALPLSVFVRLSR
jgi:23S rRNA (cytosine1962-C5)-methyltransferase